MNYSGFKSGFCTGKYYRKAFFSTLEANFFNMRFISILLVCFFFYCLPAAAQLRLVVRDAETAQPLNETLLRKLETAQLQYTDSLGQATVNWDLPATILVYQPGYSSRRIKPTSSDGLLEIALQPLNVQLGEVVVQSYAHNRPLMEVPASVQRLSGEEIGRFDQTSLLPAVNVVPGVRLEERSPGSYRVSIRGSSLRAPFGVRNVKIYWNGMPLTEPGGDTQLNFLDLLNIDNIEVIKGPAGSLYGAGTGGALLFNSEIKPSEAEAGYLSGSFGLHRAYARLGFGKEEAAYGVRVAHQQTNGYREHSALSRTNVQLSTSHSAGENSRFRTQLLYSRLSYEIPGGLNPEQYEENPQQSRPGSVETNASINYNVLISNFNYEFSLNNWQNQTTLYSYLHYFDHPFNTDYKKENTLAGGGRTLFQYTFSTGSTNSTLTAGGEYQLQQRSALNFDNAEGRPDSLNFSDEITSAQYLLFTQAELEFPRQWFFTTGLSYNRLSYNLYRLFDRYNQALSGREVNARFKAALAGRVGISKIFRPEVVLHASLSQGFSPPGLREFRTNEGSINTGLEPERGTNYELGIRGQLFNKRLYYDLTAFLFRLDQTIVSYQDASGVVLFRNSGATRQRGLELWAEYLLFQQQSGFLKESRFRQSYTYHDFRYQEYVQGNTDYQGKRMPGVPPHSFVSSLSLDTRPGLSLQADWQYVSSIYLNDANSIAADSYHLLRMKLGYTLNFNKVELALFAGADNLLNQKYSLGNDVNPEYGNRYYQPAAGRSVFTGLRIRYQ